MKMPLPNAKAQTPTERTEAIVVSFSAKWLEAIVSKRTRAVIRKRVPASSPAQWMYFYVNTPVGAIVARGSLAAVKVATEREVYDMSDDLCLSHDDIDRYMDGQNTIGLYTIAQIELPGSPVGLLEVRKRLSFNPPQSFLFLSTHGKSVIDEISGFPK